MNDPEKRLKQRMIAIQKIALPVPGMESLHEARQRHHQQQEIRVSRSFFAVGFHCSFPLTLDSIRNSQVACSVQLV
jgi:hypothetical protein